MTAALRAARHPNLQVPVRCALGHAYAWPQFPTEHLRMLVVQLCELNITLALGASDEVRPAAGSAEQRRRPEGGASET